MMDSADDANMIDVVSIIIPAFNEVEALRACLQRLTPQTADAASVEIIVADNGSIPPLSETLAGEFPRVRFVVEARPGSYAARNAAVCASAGEVLAFTDADCLPAEDWVRRGIEAVSARGSDAYVGGAVHVYERMAGRPTTAELFERVYAFRQEENVRHGYAVTANMWTTRSVFDRVGGFASELKSGGDLRFGKACGAEGVHAAYHAELIVQHPARRCLGELVAKKRRTAGGVNSFRRIGAAGKPATVPGIIERVRRQIAPSAAARRTLANATGLGRGERLRVQATLWFLQWVALAEKLRLRFGGEPRRS